MICENFQECIDNVQVVTRQIVPKKTGKKKKSSKARDKVIVEKSLSGTPCKPPTQQEKCICYLDNRSKARCEEQSKTYVLDNRQQRKEILCIHVDGGVVNSTGVNKCDFALFIRPSEKNAESGIAIFVELKGSDTKHALEQLTATLNLPPFRNLKKTYTHIYGRIVNTSSVPNIQSTDYFLDAQEVFMKLGGNLKTREQYFEELYSDLGNL